MIVDGFATIEERAAFADRQADVWATAYHYGVTLDNAVIIGSGALALHGIDSHVGSGATGEQPFDFDAITMCDRFGDHGPTTHNPHSERSEEARSLRAPLPASLVKNATDADVFAHAFFGYQTCSEMFQDRAVVGGSTSALATLPLTRLIHGKQHADRPKDRASLIKAHVVAYAIGHEILDNPDWQQAVYSVVTRLRKNIPYRVPCACPNTWDWLSELVKSNFSHPAFGNLSRPTPGHHGRHTVPHT